MIADLKPYASYRTAEGDWLGQVPSHWTVRRMKYVVQENDSRSTTGDEQLLRVSQFTGVTQRLRAIGQEEQDTRAASLVGYKRVEPDELVINIMLAWNGSMGVSRYPGIASPAYCVYRFKSDARPWYFHHLLRSPAYKARIKSMSTGVVESRLRLYSDDLFRIEALLPPPEEQAAIVRFLDWASARLERTIRAKRRVITLLTEQKQAIIHRAVTRGLNPAVPLKPSGIAWLGDIPAHWEVRRLRTLVHRIEQGVSPLAVGFLAEGNSWGVLKSGCVNRGTFRETEHKQLASSFEIDPAIVVKVGDVLISRACGSPSLVGSVGRVKSLQYRLILSDKTFRAAFRTAVDADFMVFAMNCRYYRQQVEQAISGADGMANNLPLSSLRGFSFAIPPKDEAVAIAADLERETIGIDTAISRLNREIDLLREYRTRLVADVVTGKLDVREAAAGLPQDALPSATEPDALDADDDPGDEGDDSDELDSDGEANSGHALQT